MKATRVVRLETTVCFRITRLMNNQVKRRKSYFPKRRESDDKNAVAIVKSVSELGCVSQDSHALVPQCRKSRKNPMQKVLEPIHRVRFTKSTLRQASTREKKEPSLGKINVKVPHQRSPHATKFEDRSHEETERQERCAQSRAWNLAKPKYKLQRKNKATFYFPAEEWVLPAASTEEPEEREFAVDFRAIMHMVSKRDLNSAELETVRISKNSDDGNDGQRRGANKRRSDNICQTLGLIRQSCAS